MQEFYKLYDYNDSTFVLFVHFFFELQHQNYLYAVELEFKYKRTHANYHIGHDVDKDYTLRVIDPRTLTGI